MSIGASVWSHLRAIGTRAVAVLALTLMACSGDGPSEPDQIQYASLVITINGLPEGANANVSVTGPGGFSQSVTASTTLNTLAAGNYSVIVADVTHEGAIFSGAPATQTVSVGAGATVNAPPVSYQVTTGSLSVSLGGLPQSTPAQVVVWGPDGFNRTVTEATTFNGLKPGNYQVEAREVQTTSARYAAATATQSVTVAASLTATQVQVSYALATGSMAITIEGLPNGTNAAVTVTGPGFTSPVTASTVLENLTPGVYNVSAANVSSGVQFQPTPPSQGIVISATATPAVVNILYVSTATALTVNVTGLPPNVAAAVTLRAPNGTTSLLTASQTVSAILPGTYTITASTVGASCTTYSPAPSSQTVSVTNGQSSTANVAYSQGGGGLNLCIDGAYITQSVQAYDNSVPIVANREGLLRVFVRANTINAAQPTVRVRFYDGSTLVSTQTITAPVASVPTAIDESNLGSSWNAVIPGIRLQPGLRMLVDVDPSNAVLETSDADNSLPANGTPAPLDVRAVSTLNIRIVPIIQASGDTGRITESNKTNFTTPMMRMFPVHTIDADIRLPYTFTGPKLMSGGGNWSALLGELNTLRLLEASGRSYYGVVRVDYTSGVAGVGYVGVPAALGWDYQPSGHETMAHELGHNFGRLHSPCGGPAGVDPQYPYTGATIGVYGYDILSGALKAPSIRDLMSYCNPPWISDYTYEGILNYRASNPMVARLAGTQAPTTRGLLVWGRIEGGQPILEPAIEVDAPATLPTRNGPHRLEGFGAAGEALFSLSFVGDRIADLPDAETFAFVVPLSHLRGIDLDRLRFSARGRQVEQRSTGRSAVPTAQRTATGRVRVSWDASAARVALVRDARTDDVLSIARGGSVEVPAVGELDVTLSNGVRSVKARIVPR
jgi:hypothetical protein